MKKIIMIALMSVFDIVNTLYILNHGGTEENPIMDFFLGFGVEYFIVFKTILTVFSLTILYLYRGTTVFRFIRVESIISAIVMGFLALMVYQGYLIYLINL